MIFWRKLPLRLACDSKKKIALTRKVFQLPIPIPIPIPIPSKFSEKRMTHSPIPIPSGLRGMTTAEWKHCSVAIWNEKLQNPVYHVIYPVLISRNSARNVHEKYQEILAGFSRYRTKFEKFASRGPIEYQERRTKKNLKIFVYVQNVCYKTDKIIVHLILDLQVL